MARQISERAFDLCVTHEVSSEAYYKKHYQRPEWPGLRSGVTVGIGYDLGQAGRDKIRNDWNGLVSAQMLDVMMDCSGHTGSAGKRKLAQVKNKILIPWDKALHVFANRDVPAWTAGVIRYIPEAANLPPSCLGTLFDLAYNRGHSWNNAGERYKEMRAIKQHVRNGNLHLVPGEIKSMKRLWPNTKGLLRRCDDRIKLWQYGMNNERPDTVTKLPSAKLDAAVPTVAGPARTAPPATTTAQNTTTTAIVVTGGAGAVQAHSSGAGLATVAGIALAAALVAALVWWLWFRHRNAE